MAGHESDASRLYESGHKIRMEKNRKQDMHWIAKNQWTFLCDNYRKRWRETYIFCSCVI